MAVLEFCISVCEVLGKDIAYAEAVTACLVGISRSDTLEGRTDLAFAHCSFIGCIEKSVGREDEVCLLCYDDALGYRDTCLFCDIVTFALECDRVEYNTVTYDVLCVFSEDS